MRTQMRRRALACALAFSCNVLATHPLRAETSDEPEPRLHEVAPGRVFEPLQAAQRWPRFEASYLFVLEGIAGAAGIANMGATIPLLGGTRQPGEARRVPWDTWEFGLHAGIFAIFDMDAPSQALVNADYLVGPYVAVRRDAWSGFARLYHQSSHLGDEFLLQNPGIAREDIHWELLEFIAAYDLRPDARLYLGGGALLRRSSSDIGRGQLRLGGEFRGEQALFWDVHPVMALDLSWQGRGRWRTNVSLHAGLEVHSSWWKRVRVQWMAEYYRGASPDGQFRRVLEERIGSGLQVWF